MYNRKLRWSSSIYKYLRIKLMPIELNNIHEEFLNENKILGVIVKAVGLKSSLRNKNKIKGKAQNFTSIEYLIEIQYLPLYILTNRRTYVRTYIRIYK